MENLIFGLVTSRRLGINNIPREICSYSCAYCQIGKAEIIQYQRMGYYDPDEILRQVELKLKRLNTEDYPEYITIVPDGEPTLDIHLNILIQKLKTFGIPVAIITNSSLINEESVQGALYNANYLSFKVDSVINNSWKKINKPHKSIKLNSILSGIENFAKSYRGVLVTESMLLKGINDNSMEIRLLANFIQTIHPAVAYIAIPTRPTAFENIIGADEFSVAYAYHEFKEKNINVEHLTGYEGNAFASSGNFTADILSITAVHPMRKDAVLALMAKTNETEEVLNGLLEQQLIQKLEFDNQDYYLRKFNKKK